MTKVIRSCPYCKQDMEMDKGLNSTNLERLFRKPTLEDMIILIVLAMAIGSFLLYNYDIKACQSYTNNNCTVGQHNQQQEEEQTIESDNWVANVNFTTSADGG